MRFEHRAGDKCFVDYAGQTADVIDRSSGETRQAQIFVAVLGCSNYTYAEASWSQALADWVGAHIRALAFFGGAPPAFVPDNLKSGVDRIWRCSPVIARARERARARVLPLITEILMLIERKRPAFTG